MDAYSMEWLLAKIKRLELQKDMYKEQRNYYKEKMEVVDFLLHQYLALIGEDDKRKVMEEVMSLLEEVSMQAYVPECQVQVFCSGAQSPIEYAPATNRKEIDYGKKQ